MRYVLFRRKDKDKEASDDPCNRGGSIYMMGVNILEGRSLQVEEKKL